MPVQVVKRKFTGSGVWVIGVATEMAEEGELVL